MCDLSDVLRILTDTIFGSSQHGGSTSRRSPGYRSSITVVGIASCVGSATVATAVRKGGTKACLDLRFPVRPPERYLNCRKSSSIRSELLSVFTFFNMDACTAAFHMLLTYVGKKCARKNSLATLKMESLTEGWHAPTSALLAVAERRDDGGAVRVAPNFIRFRLK